MDKSKKRWLIVLGIVLLIGLIILALVLGWFSRRGKAFDSRPLVLIISPKNQSNHLTGEGILIQATAREENGLSRMEVWINDSLVETVEAEVEETTNLELLSYWVPTSAGKQKIIVRATSSDGVDGQGMVVIYTTASTDEGTGVYIAEEGDTLASIADEHGSSTDELEDLNPGLGADGPAPGDGLIVPDTEPPADGGLPPVDDGGDPPSVDPGPPLIDFPFSIVEMVRLNTDELANLRLEVTALRTWEEYGRLHCYVGLADILPQWYPDRDRNQSTDEYFENLGRGWWDTEDTMQGDAAPVIQWPMDQPLPASIFCVGTNGGTETVELEKLELNIPPEQWNGIKYPVIVDGLGGQLLVETRVSQGSAAIPIRLDPTMTVPTNVRADDETGRLEWEYYPEADELPIDGFRIYIDGTLQWVVSSDTWFSRIPTEWFDPPCGETYALSVTAFRIEGVDWPESYHARVETEQTDCSRQVEVTFVSLETFHLGGDGDHEERGGDVGPVYGGFGANRARLSFDQGREHPTWGGLDRPDGLSHNSFYNLIELAAAGRWQFSSPVPMLVAEVPADGILRVTAGMMDRDTGRCRYEGDRGCDDRLCSGTHPPITFDELIASDGEILRSEILTRNGRCRFEFEYRLVADESNTETGHEGIPPLPWLHFIDLDVNPISGETEIELQNIGTGEWAGFPLRIELLTPDGTSLGQTIFDDVEIPVDGFETFTIRAISEEPIFDVCVFIDPEDEVVEFYERAGGALVHYPLCSGLPDLRIESVSYEVRDGNWLDVTVENIGDDDLENRVVAFDIRFLDRRVPITDRFFTVPQSIPAGETRVISLGPLEDWVRENMARGYDLEINQYMEIAERSYENNILSVRDGTRLAVYLSKIHVPLDHGDEAGVNIDIFAGSPSGSTRYRQVTDWNIRDIDWDNCRETTGICNRNYGLHGDYGQPFFDIMSDETLVVVVTFLQPDTSWERGTETRVYYYPHWGAGDINPHTGSCVSNELTTEGVHTIGHRYEWDVQLKFCRENYDEDPGD